MWRPDNWKNPYKDLARGTTKNIYEAGADAMLEALMNEGIENLVMYGQHRVVVCNSSGMDLIGFDSKKLGYVVFIPGDDNET